VSGAVRWVYVALIGTFDPLESGLSNLQSDLYTTEELFFRGLILEGLKSRGIFVAIIGSAFIFGIIHLSNAFFGKFDPFGAIGNVISAFGIGICFGALRIRLGSLWPLIGMHAIFDFLYFMTMGFVFAHSQSIFWGAVFGGVYAAYGLYLMKDEIHKDSFFRGSDIS
jgi:hypothetical protein